MPLRTIPIEPSRPRTSIWLRLGTVFKVLNALYHLAGQPALLPPDHDAPAVTHVLGPEMSPRTCVP